MDKRVKRLEADASDIKKLVSDIRVLLASIDERTKHMPTHWQAFGIFLGSLAGMATIVALMVDERPILPPLSLAVVGAVTAQVPSPFGVQILQW